MKRVMKPTESNADKIFSKYIRLRYADASGTCKCVTCGSVKHWKDIDAGHFIKRQITGLRYDLRNVHIQCRRCNRFLGGNEAEYSKFIIERYGIDVFHELMNKKKVVFTGSKKLLYQEVIEKYAELVKEMEKHIKDGKIVEVKE